MNPKVVVPVCLLSGFGVLFHFFPLLFKKPIDADDKPKALKDLTKQK